MKNNEVFDTIEKIQAAKKELEVQALSVETLSASGAEQLAAEKARLVQLAKVTKLKRLKKIKDLPDSALLLIAEHGKIEEIENFASYALDKVAKFAGFIAGTDSFSESSNVTGIVTFNFLYQNIDRVIRTGENTSNLLSKCSIEPSTAGSQSSNSLKALLALNAVECYGVGKYKLIKNSFFTKALRERLPESSNRSSMKKLISNA
ncbi:MAG: hypothetical protein IBX56_19970 [Methylomicrobium sp.]|nr:hypothetical protein [Methylomicrobium sp.]